MSIRNSNTWLSRPRLLALENRIAPAGTVSLVSQAAPGLPSDTAGGASDLQKQDIGLAPWTQPQNSSADGRYIALTSTAANLVAGQVDANSTSDVFLFDRLLGENILVSRSTFGTAQTGNGTSTNPAISADGRYVAFESAATDLVTGFTDNNADLGDVYLFDRVTGAIALVSHALGLPTAGGNDASGGGPIICGDGAVIAYTSLAKNLTVGGKAGGIFHDRVSGINSSAGGIMAQDITYDGRFAVLNNGGNNFVRDRLTNEFISLTTGTTGYAEPGYVPAISGDGRFVLHFNDSTDMVPGFTGGGTGFNAYNAYLFDRSTGTNVLVSHDVASSTTAGNAGTNFGVISQDGRYVAYQSQATNLVSGISNLSGGFQFYLYDRITGTNELISRGILPGEGGNVAVSAEGLSVSSDGRYVAFASRSDNHVPGFIDGNGVGGSGVADDLYLLDRESGTIVLVSCVAGSPTQGGNGTSIKPKISADGGWISYTSAATNLVANSFDANGYQDVMVFEVATGTARPASGCAGTASKSAGGLSQSLILGSTIQSSGGRAQVSNDGRFVVFTSLATNLISGQSDANLAPDVFIFDRIQQGCELVSRATGATTTTGNGASNNPVISGDGRFVAFNSLAGNLLDGFVDGNGPTASDLFLFDRLTGETKLISHAENLAGSGGNQATDAISFSGFAGSPMSGDGRFVCFTSRATDLVGAFVDQNGADNDLYLYDRITGSNQLVSRAAGAANGGGNDNIWSSWSVSGDGKFIAFSAHATNLVAGQSGGGRDVFLYDREGGTNRLVSHVATSPTTAGNGGSDVPVISSDGRYVAFDSTANNLVAGGTDTNAGNDVFLFDCITGVNTLVSHVVTSMNSAGNYSSDRPVISADGRFVSFLSRATNIVPAFIDGNGVGSFGLTGSDVFVFDRLGGSNSLVSRDVLLPAKGSNAETYAPVMSDDGRFISFKTRATNLVTGFDDGNQVSNEDVFVIDRVSSQSRLVSHLAGVANASGAGSSYSPIISGDGAIAYFVSGAANLLSADLNNHSDVFWYSNLPAVASTQIADGFDQRSLIRSITVTFDQLVTFAGDPANAFRVERVAGGGGSVQLAVGSVQNNPNTTVTLTFSGPLTQFGSLVDGEYTLTVKADQVTGAGPLDGNNDGFGGDDYTFNFHRLFGDANGDRWVDALDFVMLRPALGSTNPEPAFNPAFDFDGDGDVDALDFLQFRERFGTSL